MEQLFEGFLAITAKQAVMMGVGAVLLYLAIAKEYEPSLLLPMGFGTLLVNIPFSSALTQMAGDHLQHGALSILFDAGIANEMFPLLIFIAIGAMIDFTPLFQNPVTFIFGITAQAGIFLTMGLALLFGFDLKEAASIGIIGAADGPTSIFVASKLAPDLVGPITVAAYSYMSLVPVIQRPVMKLMTTRAERLIRMPYTSRPVSRTTRILFPIIVTLAAGLIAPAATPLIGMLMFGNLARVSGVVERINQAAQNEISNIVTTFLGITIGSTMVGAEFLKVETLTIVALGLIAFILDTAAGVLFGKLMNVLSGGTVNPLLGGCGISAFPMSARVVQKLGQEEDYSNFLLMHAMASNTSGQIASVMAGGVVLALG